MIKQLFKNDFHSNNIISLDIYFKDLNYDVLEQVPMYEVWGLFGRYQHSSCFRSVTDRAPVRVKYFHKKRCMKCLVAVKYSTENAFIF